MKKKVLMRKGSAQDVLLAAIFLFAISIAFFVTHFMVTTTIDQMLNNTVIANSTATVTALGGVTKTLVRLDSLVLATLVAFVIGIIITGFLVSGHPVFMFIYFIIIVLSVVISTVLSDVWTTATTNATITSSLPAFPIADHIMSNLPVYIVIIGFVGIVVMFGKPYVFGD